MCKALDFPIHVPSELLSCFPVESLLSDKAGKTASKPAHHRQGIITVPGIISTYSLWFPTPGQVRWTCSLACWGREDVGSREKGQQRTRKSCQSCPQGTAQPGLITLGVHLCTSPFKKRSYSTASEVERRGTPWDKSIMSLETTTYPPSCITKDKSSSHVCTLCAVQALPPLLLPLWILLCILNSSTRTSIKARTTILDNLLWAVRCEDCGVDKEWRGRLDWGITWRLEKEGGRSKNQEHLNHRASHPPFRSKVCPSPIFYEWSSTEGATEVHYFGYLKDKSPGCAESLLPTWLMCVSL